MWPTENSLREIESKRKKSTLLVVLAGIAALLFGLIVFGDDSPDWVSVAAFVVWAGLFLVSIFQRVKFGRQLAQMRDSSK